MSREVDSLAMVIASREVSPPLAIGLFGDWAVGKSFFIKELRKRLDSLAEEAKTIEEQRGKEGYNVEPAYWSEIVQIEFNAWHYMDQNLWASFVVRIFDGLAEYIAGEKGEIATEREKILTMIEKEHEELKKLNRKMKRLKSTIVNKEKKIEELNKKISNVQEKLENLDLKKIALRRWSEILKENKNLKKAVSEFGLPEVVESYEELMNRFRELQKTDERFRMRFAALVTKGNPKLRLLFLLGILVLGTFIGIFVNHALGTGILTKFAGVASAGAAWFAGIAASAAKLLKNVNEQLSDIDNAYTEIIKEETKEDRETRDKTKEELQGFMEEKAKLNTEIERSEKEIERLTSKLEDLCIGRQLYRFIQDKATSSEYRDRLGIISNVRSDFERLTYLLSKDSREKRKKWESLKESKTEVMEAQRLKKNNEEHVAKIDRIVLYIDDLDRCSPQRVVEVLQAVHLILAFKLFVVIVAVDSRWLLRSLEKEYPDFLILDRQVLGEGEISRWASTPQNYLEKIFQIAMTIKPMSIGGYHRLLEEIISPSARSEAPPDEPTEKAKDTGTTKPPSGSKNGITGLPLGTELHLKELPEEKRKVDPNPPNLEITQKEINIMHGLFGFLGTPRAVKRFVNTYWLIRASLSPKELHEYEEKESKDSSAVLILLAILTGTPLEATWIFRALDQDSDKAPWKNFVSKIEPRPLPSKKPKDLEKKDTTSANHDYDLFWNGICPEIHQSAAARWRRIHLILSTNHKTRFRNIAPLRKWLRRVARCAFHPFKFEKLPSYEESLE